jgi:hypothetical protein
MPKVKTSRGFVALFEKIHDGEPIFTVFFRMEFGVLYSTNMR